MDINHKSMKGTPQLKKEKFFN